MVEDSFDEDGMSGVGVVKFLLIFLLEDYMEKLRKAKRLARSEIKLSQWNQVVSGVESDEKE